MRQNMKNKSLINNNRDYLIKLFCRFVVVFTIVLILINGFLFFKFLIELVKKNHSQPIESYNPLN